MKWFGGTSSLAYSLTVLLLALMPLALAVEGSKGSKGRHQSTPFIRHVRSVDEPGEHSSSASDVLEQEEVQSNSESEEEPEGVHKVQKSFLIRDLPLQNLQMLTAPHGPVLHKWLFRGTGQPQFPRGLRRDSHFIRFGRNQIDMYGTNKKNNFIRLGRENPRRTNFIRLGRSGSWGNNEKFGAKVGFFPDYYSQLFGGNPKIWDFEAQQPVPLGSISSDDGSMSMHR